jgi:hypothetical protein
MPVYTPSVGKPTNSLGPEARRALPVNKATPAPKAVPAEDIFKKRYNEGFAEGKAWAKTHGSWQEQLRNSSRVQDLKRMKELGYTGVERAEWLRGFSEGFNTYAEKMPKR